MHIMGGQGHALARMYRRTIQLIPLPQHRSKETKKIFPKKSMFFSHICILSAVNSWQLGAPVPSLTVISSKSMYRSEISWNQFISAHAEQLGFFMVWCLRRNKARNHGTASRRRHSTPCLSCFLMLCMLLVPCVNH